MPDKPWEPPKASEILERQKRVQDDMIDLRRNHLLNQSFFHGDQWVRWDDSAATVNIVEFLSDQEGQARSTVNKLKPRLTSLHARLCRTPLDFQVQPEGVDSFAIQKARLARQVLDVKAHRDQWALTRRQNVRDLLLGGVAAIITEPAYEFDDAPVIDPATGETLRLPSKPRPRIRSLSALEFGFEPGSANYEDALWCIVNTTLTPEQAKRRYKLDYTPNADADAQQGAMQRALWTNRRGSTRARACKVLVYYEHPTDETPGCVIHVLNDKIVEQHPWLYPFDQLPLTPFVETEIGGTWKGDTRMNDARQLQMQINKAYTSINANLGRTDNMRMLIPEGAILDGEDDLTGTAGEVVRYNSEQGRPEWMQPPQIPRWLREHIDNLESELDDLFSTHAISQGKQVGDRNSGLALSILAEKDETPLGLIAEDQQRGWQRVAEQVLMLERHLMVNVDEATGQQMRVSDVSMRPGVSASETTEMREVSWTADDLPEHPVVYVPLDAVMPKSQAAVQDVMLKLAANPAFAPMFQQLKPEQLATVLQVSDPSVFARVADPHVENANWENARMANGDDETVVMVEDWQPHAVHIDSHNKFRATAGYRDATPEIRQFVDAHVEAHKTLLLQEQQANMAYQQQQAQPPPQPMNGQIPQPAAA